MKPHRASDPPPDPGRVVGLGLLRRNAAGALTVDGECDTFCAVLVLKDGAVAWQPADLSRLNPEQLRLVGERLRHQLDLVERAGGRA